MAPKGGRNHPGYAPFVGQSLSPSGLAVVTAGGCGWRFSADCQSGEGWDKERLLVQ